MTVSVGVQDPLRCNRIIGADIVPSPISMDVGRPLPVLFDVSLSANHPGVSTFDAVSRDCVSVLTLI